MFCVLLIPKASFNCGNISDDEVCDPGAGASSASIPTSAEVIGSSGEPTSADLASVRDEHHEECAEDDATSG